MEVRILETKTITPSSPPFIHDHELPLSRLDNDPNLRVTFRYFRAYAGTDAMDQHPFHVIATALSSALLHYYPLAANIRHVSNNRLSLSCQVGQGVPLVNATIDQTLDSLNYLDDPDPHFVEQLVPDPKSEDVLLNPCVLQVTVFKCGGFTLGAAIHHALCDGLGATVFFNAVAELARGASKLSVQPVWDRANLLGLRDPPWVEGPIGEFLSLKKGFEPYSHTVGPVVRQCFPVTDEILDRLKDELLEKCGLGFTTFEALGAYVWRAKVRSSGIHEDEKVTFAYALNIRKIVKPPLPAGYYGNGCVPMYAQLMARQLVQQPLWQTAELIKKSKSNATDKYVRSFIYFQELHREDGITAGKEVSGFTDWRHLGHSSVDFGWGSPVNVFPLSTNLLGSMEPCFFLPNVGKKHGFKVIVTLRETAIITFREEMEKFNYGDFGLS